MKTLVATLTASAGLLAMSTAAQAVTFQLDSFDVQLHDSGPGLLLDWKPILETPAVGDLDVGDHVVVNLFKIWTNETTVNRDDRVDQPISVDFEFSLPEPFGGQVSGETDGIRRFAGFYQAGRLRWDGPSILNFGNGGELEVSLSDEIFNEGIFFGLNEGKRHGAIVQAKFALLSDSVEDVPEPTAFLGLSLLGLGFLGKRLVTGAAS